MCEILGLLLTNHMLVGKIPERPTAAIPNIHKHTHTYTSPRMSAFYDDKNNKREPSTGLGEAPIPALQPRPLLQPHPSVAMVAGTPQAFLVITHHQNISSAWIYCYRASVSSP